MNPGGVVGIVVASIRGVCMATALVGTGAMSLRCHPQTTVSHATVKPLDACATLGSAQRDGILALRAHDENDAGLTPLPDVFDRCFQAHGGGVWGFVLSTTRVDTYGTRYQELSASHVDAVGTISGVPMIDPLTGSPVQLILSDTWIELNEPILFDYDGDGKDEFVWTGWIAVHEGPRPSFGQVLTAARGRVEPYPPANALDIVGVRDVDADGRPDLLDRGRHARVLGTSECSGFEHVIEAFPFVAHSLPDGTYASSDEIARRDAASHCPARPKRLLVQSSDGDIDDDETAGAVVCARVWGETEQSTVDRLRREVSAYHPANQECSTSALRQSSKLVEPFAATPQLQLGTEALGNR